jgi:hypothetical protein
MRFSINLRSDLAKLSDTELTERLDSAWQTYDSTKKPWLWRGPLWRSPVRHPRAYRFLSLLGTVSGSWFDLLFAAALSAKGAEPFLRRSDRAMDLDLTICEIRDLMEEMERRVSGQRAVKGKMR